jgi:hypothetical protein
MLLFQTMQNIKFLKRLVTMELLAAAIANVEWIFPPLQPPPLATYSSLHDVSIACHLNQKQHTMFILAGCTLVKSYECNSSMNADVEPLYVCLGGNARIGKSCVIHALLTLAFSWQWLSAIMVVTYMGIAALNAKSQTIHTTFNFSLNNKPKSIQSTTKEIEMFSGLHLLIIKEASMCAQALLGSIDGCLR